MGRTRQRVKGADGRGHGGCRDMGVAGGVGIMADDAMAGIYANLTLRLLIWLLPAWIH